MTLSRKLIFQITFAVALVAAGALGWRLAGHLSWTNEALSFSFEAEGGGRLKR